MGRRNAGRANSVQELKLRAELDRLKRELKKLKGPKDGVAEGEVEELRHQVADLTAVRQRLSRLYFGQVEENRKRSEKLHKILENIGQINSDLDLEMILARLAETIRTALGFKIVLLRLREPGTERLRACAFAGIEEDGRARLAAQDVLVSEFESWLKDEFRVSRSYFISHAHEFNRRLPNGYTPDLGPREEWEWNQEDVLLVPLHSRESQLVGYLSVDDPVDRLVPSEETVELLEIFGNHAVVAIENARLYGELARHTRQLEEAGRRMREMHALRSNFVSTVSHELRTPLTSIRAYVDALLGVREGQIDHRQLLHFLSIINEESDRLTRLIETVLDLNRFDSGTMRLVRQPVDLAALCDEVIHQLWPMAEAGHVSLKEASDAADTLMDADRDQLRQLLMHLGSNAIKFTPPGGSVTFRILGDDHSITLKVEDSGIGIPEEALEKVFDRFYQVDSSLARRYGGTGLGLAICKSIVEWHGGHISAQSVVGQGTCFTVSLPRRIPLRVTVRHDVDRPAGVDDVLRLAIETVADVMDTRVVSLLAPGPDGDLRVEAAIGLEEDVVRSTRVRPGAGVAGWVAERRRPVCVANADDPGEVPASGRSCYRSGTFLSVPLEGREGLMGVLNVTDPRASGPLGAEECHLLLQLSNRIAAAWEQVLDAGRGGPEPERAAQSLRQMTRMEGPATPSEELAAAVARHMGLGEAEVAAIRFAAGIRADGPGQEADAPRALETMTLVREIALARHEWWDGSGFPRGLRGEDIPTGGRVLAVVCVWEALTTARAHAPARTREEALDGLRALAGQQLDPRAVQAFERAVAEFEREQHTAPPGTRAATIATQGGE